MIFLLTFAVIIVVILAMSVGVILGQKPIKGSCGGLGDLGLKEDCPICGDYKETIQLDSDRLALLSFNLMEHSDHNS